MGDDCGEKEESRMGADGLQDPRKKLPTVPGRQPVGFGFIFGGYFITTWFWPISRPSQ